MYSEFTTKNCQSPFPSLWENAFDKRMCHAQTRKENFNSMRLSYPDPFEIFSLIILNDILLMHNPVGVRRSVINFTRDRSMDSIKVEKLHRYFSRMMAISDVYT